MTATNSDHDGHNHDDHNHDGHKHVFWRWYDREFAMNLVFLKSTLLVFHVFITVAVMVYLVAVTVTAVMV